MLEIILHTEAKNHDKLTAVKLKTLPANTWFIRADSVIFPLRNLYRTIQNYPLGKAVWAVTGTIDGRWCNQPPDLMVFPVIITSFEDCDIHIAIKQEVELNRE